MSLAISRVWTNALGITKGAQFSLQQIKNNTFLNAWASTIPEEEIIAAAVEAELRVRKKSAIDGRLIGIKDNIATTDLPTTCASNILRDYVSPFDATVVTRLRDAGAIIVGKTNMDEFGMGSHSTFSIHGAVTRSKYDWRIGVSAGGSSGGSACAVSLEMCNLALGTDTGGSVRLPASYCGIIGFKPSYGLLSRWGVIAYANSLDTVGILARNTLDALTLFKILNFYDSHDPTSISPATRERTGKHLDALRAAAASRPLRIGVPAEYNVQELSCESRQVWNMALEHLSGHGAEIVQISLPTTTMALPAYYILAPAEASSNLARYDGLRYGSRAPEDRSAGGTLFAPTRDAGFGQEVAKRILLGTYTLSSSAIGNYFLQAQRVRRLVQRDFDNAFAMPNTLLTCNTEMNPEGVDAIVTPTALGPPPTLQAVRAKTDLENYINDALTVPASLAGIPAISVPVGREMIGIQVMCQWGDEARIWQVARLLEELKEKAAEKSTPVGGMRLRS